MVEVSPDIHICGFCKQQYNNFEVFFAHKQNGCSLPTSDTPAAPATASLTGKTTLYSHTSAFSLSHVHANLIYSHLHALKKKHIIFSFCSDSSAEFVFEETYQTCVVRGVKKTLTKAQKTPSKKLKPALTSKRHSCCFSGWCLSPFMTVTRSFFFSRPSRENGRQSSPVSLAFYLFRTLLD